jgi:hypothetical protein
VGVQCSPVAAPPITGPSALPPRAWVRDRRDVPGGPETVPIVIKRRVPVPASVVYARLLEDPAALLGSADRSVDGPGGTYLVPLSARIAGVHFDRTAAVGVGPAIEEDDGSRILPLWWEAAEQPWLFPTFDGGLEVRPVATGAELRLEGHYRPPLGSAGRLVNWALLHRAATASLEALLDRLSSRLIGRHGQPLGV